MKMRHAASIVLATGVALAWTASSFRLQASGEAQKTEARSSKTDARKSWTPPRTPWGDPDIEGLWPGTDFVGVPLQRPDGLGTRNELTDAEFAVRLQNFQKQTDED